MQCSFPFSSHEIRKRLWDGKRMGAIKETGKEKSHSCSLRRRRGRTSWTMWNGGAPSALMPPALLWASPALRPGGAEEGWLSYSAAAGSHQTISPPTLTPPLVQSKVSWKMIPLALHIFFLYFLASFWIFYFLEKGRSSCSVILQGDGSSGTQGSGFPGDFFSLMSPQIPLSVVGSLFPKLLPKMTCLPHRRLLWL